MKKLFGKFLLFLGVLFLLSLNDTALAAEANNELIGVTTNPTYFSNLYLKGTKKPKDVWSWSKGAYKMSGATVYSDLYSNYLFSATSKLKIVFTKADEPIEVEVYERTGWFRKDKIVKYEKISRLTREHLDNHITRKVEAGGLSSSSKYYVKILCPAHFIATVDNK